jgi:hypothetical protein
VTLAWSASAGATSYAVYYSTGTSFTPAGNAATTTFVVQNLAPSTLYYFQVSARGPGGTSPATTQQVKITTAQ